MVMNEVLDVRNKSKMFPRCLFLGYVCIYDHELCNRMINKDILFYSILLDRFALAFRDEFFFCQIRFQAMTISLWYAGVSQNLGNFVYILPAQN